MGVSIPVGFGQWTLPFALTGDLEEMVITCGFTDDVGASPDDIATTITNVLFATATFAASSVNNQYVLGPGRVTVNRALGTFEGVGSVTRTGTNAVSALPQNCAILASKRTLRGGRHGRGRLYLPPAFISEGNVTPTGGLLETVRASIELDLNTWRANLIPLNLPLQLLHQAPPVGPAIPPDGITAFNVSTRVATQRTRLRR